MSHETYAEREARVKDLYSKGPVLKGAIYCSPWCGFKCTKAAYDDAKRSAGELRDYLGSKRWKPRVWENMGWHYEVTNGFLAVMPSGMDYRAEITIGNVLHDGVNGVPQFFAKHRDARRAVADAMSRFDAWIEQVIQARNKIKV